MFIKILKHSSLILARGMISKHGQTIQYGSCRKVIVFDMVKSIATVLRQNVAPRVLGFDDAPFGICPRVPLSNVNFVGVLTSGARFEDMLYSSGIQQDGLNATECLARAILNSKFHAQTHAVLLDGVTVGGLNVVDIKSLANAVNRPIVAVMRRHPDVPAMLAAIARLPHAEERARRLREAGRVFEIGRWIFQFQCPVETDVPDPQIVADLLDICAPDEAQKIPECLRLAHRIGAAVERGKSSSVI